MCTLLTISREIFESDYEYAIKHIRKDADGNSHGFGLLTLGDKEEESALIHTMSIEVVIAMLTADDKWKRMWLHSRYATGVSINLFGCHPFSSVGEGRKYYGELETGDKQFIAMHNGVLSNKDSKNFFVDSMYIGTMLRMHGLDKTLDYLKTETYANVFMVNPINGEWAMSRSSSGTLYKDEHGNYATTPYSNIITTPVQQYTNAKHKHTQTPRVSPYWTGGRYGHSSYYDGKHWNDNNYICSSYSNGGNSYASRPTGAATSANGSTKSRKNKDRRRAWTDDNLAAYNRNNLSVVSGDKNKHLNYSSWKKYYKDNPEANLAEDIKTYLFASADDFLDLVYDHGWVTDRVPNDVYRCMSSKQKNWLKNLRDELGLTGGLQKEEEEAGRRSGSNNNKIVANG
jgi:predicted glutamine amidotransferase